MSASRAEMAVRLPWLAPGADALAALARADFVALDRHLRHDPGFALLWLRAGAPNFVHDSAREPLIRLALHRLSEPPVGRVDESNAAVVRVLTSARRIANAAELIARETGFDPLRAAAAGLLAPLGWLALAAVGSESATAEEAGAVSRKIARQWALPDWFTDAVGNRDLPPSAYPGADGVLCGIVRRAAADHLRFAPAATTAENSVPTFQFTADETPPTLIDPYSSPHLRELLQLALQNLEAQRTIPILETENESLRRALCDQHDSCGNRVKIQKLSALAEFAAGAGHEINNPLAVISGQAQYLLMKVEEPELEKPLHVIIQQAHRVHAILTDLMQFARPGKPQKRTLDICDAARTVATNLHEFAALQRVRIELITPDDPCPVEADTKQLQTALGSLLRNAIEAAPEDGWVRIAVEQTQDRWQVVFEDSGDGPTAKQREHMFDPFFSGRSAGRGRGLGLPTAWRLAREHGGDVVFDPRPDSPARFVLSLPRAVEIFPLAERLSA